MLIVSHPNSARYASPGHPEAPFRVVDSVAHLRASVLELQWVLAEACPERLLRLAHDPSYLEDLRRGVGDDFDADTARHEAIFEHAALASGAAWQCLDHVMAGTQPWAFSLMRPPGHHATSDQAMGFCYLSHAAICALAARESGLDRVAVFDFDVHHGNGTEAILHGKEGIDFFSVHQYPAYPGTGAKSFDNCHNYPVPPQGPRERHLDALRAALADLLATKPNLIVVSAGFDAYENDPLAQGTLKQEDFHWIGNQLSQSRVPFMSILEGGYSRELPKLIEAYLRGCS